MTSFFSELKRRNVLRVAAAYAVVAWIIIEAGSVLLPTFGASESAFKIYTLVVIGGFVVALVLAWVFELTSEGVKLEKNVDKSESITNQTGRKLDFAIIGLLIIALGISVTLNITGMRGAELSTATSASRMSIAVLPFESRSTDPTNALFADGMHDDLLARLANIAALRVISRTSVMEYRNSTKNLRQIAVELGVRTVLEGAVQRVGDNVRIYATLIDAETDEQIWANTYDRKFNVQSIFAIQSEISGEISGALRAELTSEEQTRLANVPTENMEAYNLYIQGRVNMYQRRLDTILQAREQFTEAAKLDPEYAEAYAGLAESVLLLFNNHAAVSFDEMLAVAEPALDRALALDPKLADAYASLGLLKHKIWDESRRGPELAEAEAAYRRAIELNPNNARAYMWFAAVRTSEERFEEAIDLYHRSLEVDPLGRIPYVNLPGLYALMGRNDEAVDLYIKAARIHPEWPTPYLNLANHLQGLGRFDEAIAWGLQGEELSTDPLARMTKIGSYVEFGEYEQIRSAVAEIPAEHPMYELGQATEWILQGDFVATTKFFEDIVAKSDNPRQFMFNLIAGSAVLAGDYGKAREYIVRRNPEFTADADLVVNRFNVADTILYAFVLQKQGEKQRAAELLTAALPVVRRLPRVGLAGHGIRDVQILALQGRSFEALAAMQDAIDAGFRGTIFSNAWPLSIDPYIESIRDRPEFTAMVSQIDDAVDVMRERVVAAEESGNWDELRALADSG